MLLDDPFAELDARRAARILELLARARSAGRRSLAVPRDDDMPEAFTRLERWRVDGGVLARSTS